MSNKKSRLERFQAKTDNQTEYIRSLIENEIVFCTGPAGTGKTMIAVYKAVQELLDEQSPIQKIIITRPTVESGKGLGFLPGELKDKVTPYVIPVLNYLEYFLTTERNDNSNWKKYLTSEQIIIQPLEYMRGMTYHNSFAILDEAQNATFEQIKMFLTRMGGNSKFVLTGDISQTDLYGERKDGLKRCVESLKGLSSVGIVELETDDIMRHPLIRAILTRLES